MRVFVVLLCLAVSLAHASPIAKKLQKKSVLSSLGLKSIEADSKSIGQMAIVGAEGAGAAMARAKKQASTTFCVEIRQNGAQQVPCAEQTKPVAEVVAAPPSKPETTTTTTTTTTEEPKPSTETVEGKSAPAQVLPQTAIYYVAVPQQQIAPRQQIITQPPEFIVRQQPQQQQQQYAPQYNIQQSQPCVPQMARVAIPQPPQYALQAVYNQPQPQQQQFVGNPINDIKQTLENLKNSLMAPKVVGGGMVQPSQQAQPSALQAAGIPCVTNNQASGLISSLGRSAVDAANHNAALTQQLLQSISNSGRAWMPSVQLQAPQVSFGNPLVAPPAVGFSLSSPMVSASLGDGFNQGSTNQGLRIVRGDEENRSANQEEKIEDRTQEEEKVEEAVSSGSTVEDKPRVARYLINEQDEAANSLDEQDSSK